MEYSLLAIRLTQWTYPIDHTIAPPHPHPETTNFFQELRKEQVLYIVAPYKADAQLAYLSRRGYISAVMSEDSDMAIIYYCNVVLASGSEPQGRFCKLDGVRSGTALTPLCFVVSRERFYTSK